MEIMLGKKQIWVIFLFEFKMGCKVEETTHNINNTFGTGTANEHQVQWWFKKFCKESLEDEECSGWPSKVEMTNWEPSLKLILLQLHEKLPNNSASIILPSFGIWSKLERWKSSISGCLISWLQTKKIVILKCCRLLLYTQQWSISQPDCDVQRKVDFIWQLSKTNLVAGLRSSSEALPKAKLTLKNGHGHCFVVCWQSDPLQLSESLQNHYIWYVCSANGWDALDTKTPPPGTGQLKGPDSSPPQGRLQVAQPTLQTLNELSYEVLPHPPYSPDLSPINYHFFKHLDNFLQENCFHNQKDAENAFQEFVKSWGMILMLQE